MLSSIDKVVALIASREGNLDFTKLQDFFQFLHFFEER